MLFGNITWAKNGVQRGLKWLVTQFFRASGVKIGGPKPESIGLWYLIPPIEIARCCRLPIFLDSKEVPLCGDPRCCEHFCWSVSLAWVASWSSADWKVVPRAIRKLRDMWKVIICQQILGYPNTNKHIWKIKPIKQHIE